MKGRAKVGRGGPRAELSASSRFVRVDIGRSGGGPARWGGHNPFPFPELPWNGKSGTLLVGSGEPWQTAFEASGGKETPRYEATVAWLKRLDEASPEIEMISLCLARASEAKIWSSLHHENPLRHISC